MSHCIFCENVLTADTKPEHILLDALGGRKTTRKAICSSCNNRFGNTIDKAVADQVAQFRNLLDLPSGSGSPPPVVKATNKKGENVRLRGDGVPEIVQKPFSVTLIEGGGREIQINARDDAHLADIVPHLAAQLRLTEDQVWKLLEDADGAYVSRRAGTIHQQLSLGGEDSLRSIAKAALCLIASVYGSEPLRSSAYGEVRDFVMQGSAEFNQERGTLDPRRLEKADMLAQRFGQLFSMLYVRSDGNGRTIAHFTLYNLVAWQIVLAERGGIPNLHLALASNPLVPSEWSDEIAAELDIPFEWLDSANNDNVLPATVARLNSALQDWVERTSPLAVRHITNGIFARYGITDDNQALNDHPHLDEIIGEISNALPHYAVGLPHKRKLTAADVLRMRACDKEGGE